MSKKSKLEKFAENQQCPILIEPGKDVFNSIKGKWREFFNNDNIITVELACGRGEYTLGLARQFPDRNFVGVDVKGDRVWKGSQEAMKQGLKNVAFLRINILNIDELFGDNEVDEIWLTFPDPRPKKRDVKHRLTNPKFLRKYQQILHPKGWFKLKTDNTAFFEYTLEILETFDTEELQKTSDLYQSKFLDEHFNILTKYERIWTEKGENIKYLKFKFS